MASGVDTPASIQFVLARYKLRCHHVTMRATPSAHESPAVLAPPDGVPLELPVSTRVQTLPFEKLTWQNFERLCHRLTALDGDVEHCVRYGRQGDAQEGIDIFARRADGRYHCLQAKRHHSFGPANLRDAVDLFVAGSWAARATRFTIAVQASLRSTVVQEEIERLTQLLVERGIAFSALDGEDLTDRLRAQPVLVDDFFGRSWVVALLGQDVADGLGSRLDGVAFARVRAQLARVYEAQFQHFDPGSFGSVSDEDGCPALTLLERFLKPDMLVREVAQVRERSPGAEIASEGSTSAADSPRTVSSDGTRPSDTLASSRMRRVPLAEWLDDSQRLVLLGDAGCGKSTLLRVIALDLLRGQSYFPELATRWGQHIPVYIPFARWSSQVARDRHTIGIKEIVRRSLEQFLTGSIVELLDRVIDDKRVLLLIDGLDEWNVEQAARATLSALVTTVEAHDIPVIVSGRPRGLSRIGSLPYNWKRGSVAPLSVAQQSAIAARWFDRYSAASSVGIGVSEGGLRNNRFMAELARDANLGALATVPLLLVGLVILALRGQILPRTRTDIYDQLVRVLLELHPDRRATASGDTESRFRYATDPIQRRAAIASLAYAMRKDTGGAGMPLLAAREVLRVYLASPQGFDLTDADAAVIAGEILAVNAETQGLLVEKAPGEVGFVHASFEEFLGAEHIGGWPFSEIEVFVRAHAGEGRWRNVISNLIGRIERRDEFDRLVAIIEIADSDEVARFHRQVLLGDIAFGAAMRATATTRRLALATMQRVETEDWLPARREALASVLKGLADPALKDDVERCLSRWVPARMSHRAPLIAKFGAWQPTARLQDLLFRAMHDEDRSVQRAAASAYATAFSTSADACQRLVDGLACTRDLATAAALLESLALGWRDAPEAAPLFEEAWRLHKRELGLVGILGLASRGTATDEAIDAVLLAQGFWSDISYPHRELAATMLMKYWPGNDTLIKGALGRASRHFDSPWELDVAYAYLMESAVDRDDVRTWILAELGRDHPFNVMGGSQRLWSQVGRFAAADPEIRFAANNHWLQPKNRFIGMYNMPMYVAQVADPPIAAMLKEVLGDKQNGFNRYWALAALLAGWGRDHVEVRSAIDSLADAADEDLIDLASLLPMITREKAVAREKLIRMAKRRELRRDLLTIGLEGCGCDAADNEAVAAILAFPRQMNENAYYSLFRAFGSNAKVRALALELTYEADGPLAAIAAAYPDDPEFASVLLDAAVPLPVDLRTQVIEVAATGATGTVLEVVLAQAMSEADPELRARMVIAHYRALPSDGRDAARQTLVAKAVEVGHNNEPVRAAALAGLVTIDALDALATVQIHGRPLPLETGGLIEGIDSVERMICERFAEFKTVFGESLSERIRSIGQGNRLVEILSAAPGASPAARAEFLELVERGEIQHTLYATRILRALAAERPRSDLLLARCWDMLDISDGRNDRAMVNADVGLILRDHFTGDADVRRQLIRRFRQTPAVATAIPLAIFAPDAEELTLVTNFDELGHEFADWTVAVHVAARRADSAAFCKLLETMVTRRWRSQFDAQQITNLAVEERLQRDLKLEVLLSARIAHDVDPSVSGSFARYLSAAGKLGPEARSKALDLLQAFGTGQRLPVAGYDAIADQWRSIRATLLDAVSAGLELG